MLNFLSDLGVPSEPLKARVKIGKKRYRIRNYSLIWFLYMFLIEMIRFSFYVAVGGGVVWVLVRLFGNALKAFY